MSTQPTLPAPTTPTELEAAWIEDQPNKLFPENQDSNFGQYRKMFTNRLQDVANQLDLIHNEMFPETSVTFLNFWEDQLGIPQAPAGESIATRQFWVLARLKRGRFTRTLRRQIVEAFIEATFGIPPVFGPGGIILGSGVPLFAPTGSITSLYKIIENIPGFSYVVLLDHTVTPDMTGLTRELTRITAGGISFSFATMYQVTGGSVSNVQSSGLEAHVP